MEKIQVIQSHQLLQNHFELAPIEESEVDIESLWSKSIEALSKEIAYLIDHDFQRLVFILYRIDVDENKVKNALATSGFEKAPTIIAEMILNRQVEKVKSRKAYKK